MSLITIISDFGYTDHYVAALKASMYKLNSNLNIVDISHSIKKYNISHAAHTIRNVYKDFPEGSIHIICVKASEKKERIVVVKINEHYFISYDTGIFSLIDLKENYTAVSVDYSILSSFPEKSIMGPIAVKLAANNDISTIGKPIMNLNKRFFLTKYISNNNLTGNILRIDHYGNLITNIHLDDFNNLKAKVSENFEIIIGIEKLIEINKTYSDVNAGELFALFNSNQFLEIGMNLGNASKLLGMKEDDPISINFL
ncbi:MAG: S-adenosyl-l-methionine hydroxide adenosyltransferase [Cytophagia bacterium]|nr:S-adenosyl-l-methionine hydroxide adenosyltransferase [Cytophagia bacterium]|tara:strand:- start:387 stop:1154 length:768 start_codon:yes stop_codon:yes gene_type:complete